MSDNELSATISTPAGNSWSPSMHSLLTRSSIPPSSVKKENRLINELGSLHEQIEQHWSVTLYDLTDVTKWKLTLAGLSKSPYEGGSFEIEAIFCEMYPFKPPQLRFITKIFHPNVASDGFCCLDIFTTWKSSISMREILKKVYDLVLTPDLDYSVSHEAAMIFNTSHEEFEAKAMEWTQNFAIKQTESNRSEESSRSTSPESCSTEAEDASENGEQISHPEDTSNTCVPWFYKWINTPNSDNNWQTFSDVDTATLEDAYLKYKERVDLGHCVIDLNKYVLYHKIDQPIQARIKRAGDSETDYHSRGKSYESKTDTKCVTFYKDESCRKIPTITLCLQVDDSVDAVIEGIRQAMPNSESQANVIIAELKDRAASDASLFYIACLHQYTKWSFLSTLVNEFLREEDSSRVNALGPFVKQLLLCFKKHPLKLEKKMKVYRAINLDETQLDKYEQCVGKTNLRWPNFSSTSRERTVAEKRDSNTLMIITLKRCYPDNDRRAADIVYASEFREEQEVLLRAGVEFSVKRCLYDKTREKHYLRIHAYV
ncbi:unnamed protein product [Adineta ricciae]|uniref:UBC core domain-containing protein n=1 Tax=Adineta ricciae TaxID=249248 RepID=A0A816DBW3_ADIRI|nr:unnamed protein product [Adineta ricciae]CAF1635263.1 unnamed protein product [Adineta ricciae]